MAYIDNSKTSQELADAIRGNATSNIAPVILNNSIQPVIDINPKKFRTITVVKSTTGNATMYTTPTDRDFYLYASHITMASSAAGASLATISSTLSTGEAADLNITLTETSLASTNHSNSTIVLPIPIKLARGVAITSTGGGNAPSTVRYIIYGYVDG